MKENRKISLKGIIEEFYKSPSILELIESYLPEAASKSHFTNYLRSNGYETWNVPITPAVLEKLLLKLPKNGHIIFYDYAGTVEGKYYGLRPQLLLVQKQFDNNVRRTETNPNQLVFIYKRQMKDTGRIISQDDVKDFVKALLHAKDDFGNLLVNNAYAIPKGQKELSLADLDGAIGRQLDIPPLQ